MDLGFLLMRCADKTLDLSRPQVMGVLNVTPDSFSDGGAFLDLNQAIEHAAQMVDSGAAVIDIGGESSRPGAQPISAQQELDRVLPVLEMVLAEHSVLVSVDTRKPEVMQAAISAGAHLINDINALRHPDALAAVAPSSVGLCLMHMQGEPQTMQVAPKYADPVVEVKDFLARRVQACLAAGISQDRLAIDPGFGFGKTLSHNVALLKRLEELTSIGVPLLVGLSRKSMLGQITGLAVDQREAASLTAAVIAVERGARLVRVHDVAATVQAFSVLEAIIFGDKDIGS